MDRTVPFLNGCISFVAFITALVLVVYMLVAFVTGMFDLSLLMFDTLLLDPKSRQSILTGINSDFLHNIAVLLILMKAYKILVEYMRYHHIDIKYMVEIGIIACILELLFNFNHYTEDMRVVLAAISVFFLAIYAFRYEALTKASADAQKAHVEFANHRMLSKDRPKETKAPKVARAAKKTARRTTKKKDT